MKYHECDVLPQQDTLFENFWLGFWNGIEAWRIMEDGTE